MKTEEYKLYSWVFWIFLPNTIIIDPYNFELYHFKVGVFFTKHGVLTQQCTYVVCHAEAHTHYTWYLSAYYSRTDVMHTSPDRPTARPWRSWPSCTPTKLWRRPIVEKRIANNYLTEQSESWTKNATTKLLAVNISKTQKKPLTV